MGKHTRKIVVDGERYEWSGSWSHDLDGTRVVWMRAWLDGARASAMEAHFVGGEFVLPAEVAQNITFARAHGWDARTRGAAWVLQPNAELTLKRGYVISRPAPIERWAPEGAVYHAMFTGGSAERIANALHVPPVVSSPYEWESPAFYVREGFWTKGFTKTFDDLLRLLDAGAERATHAEGMSTRTNPEHVVLEPGESERLAAAAPFPGARHAGGRVWIAGSGNDASVECVTMSTSPARANVAWRWITTTRERVIDRRTKS